MRCGCRAEHPLPTPVWVCWWLSMDTTMVSITATPISLEGGVNRSMLHRSRRAMRAVSSSAPGMGRLPPGWKSFCGSGPSLPPRVERGNDHEGVVSRWYAPNLGVRRPQGHDGGILGPLGRLFLVDDPGSLVEHPECFVRAVVRHRGSGATAYCTVVVLDGHDKLTHLLSLE